MAGHGGRREGAGRPSAFQREQKAAAARQKLSAAEERRLRALAAAEEHLFQAAEQGEKWAVQELLDRERGKAAVKPAEVADTEINLIVHFPREPFPCPHCGKEISGEREGSQPHAAVAGIRGGREGLVREEDGGVDGGGEGPGSDAQRP